MKPHDTRTRDAFARAQSLAKSAQKHLIDASQAFEFIAAILGEQLDDQPLACSVRADARFVDAYAAKAQSLDASLAELRTAAEFCSPPAPLALPADEPACGARVGYLDSGQSFTCTLAPHGWQSPHYDAIQKHRWESEAALTRRGNQPAWAFGVCPHLGCDRPPYFVQVFESGFRSAICDQHAWSSVRLLDSDEHVRPIRVEITEGAPAGLTVPARPPESQPKPETAPADHASPAESESHAPHTRKAPHGVLSSTAPVAPENSSDRNGGSTATAPGKRGGSR
jgi:hypothetical protein